MRVLAALAAAWLTAAAAAHAAPAVPRTADGRPDLQGVWTNASLTKLTRSAGTPGPAVDKATARRMAAANPQVRGLQADAAPSDPNAGAPPPGDPGGYNGFWLDAGSTLGRVRGEYRTSWLVDPADGQLPFSAEGRRRVAEAQAFARRADVPAGPEDLQPWDRCLISSRGSGGPGMLNNVYNSNYQIVQTPTAVAIEVEMVHDVRIVPLFRDRAAAQAGHGPSAVHRWLGDSTGWWEGDTLVVETVGVNPEQGRAGPIFLTPQGRVTERFTRASPTEITYAFEVDDPAYYTRPWRAEMSLTASRQRLFEYACHEGNYAMSGILRGARVAERPAPAATPGAAGAP